MEGCGKDECHRRDISFFKTELHEVNGMPCIFAWYDSPSIAAIGSKRAITVVLDGTKTIRYLREAVASGMVEPDALPCMVGIDAGNRMDDYTPWPHEPFREDSPAFGGGAETFLREILVPVSESIAHDPGLGGEGFARHVEADSLSLFGYSLSGLMALYVLAQEDCFRRYLIASPSCWYPGFTEYFIETVRPTDASVLIACGEDEGRAHPEPLRSVRRETDRIVEVLKAGVASSVELYYDSCDHYQGIPLRANLLLTKQ